MATGGDRAESYKDTVTCEKCLDTRLTNKKNDVQIQEGDVNVDKLSKVKTDDVGPLSDTTEVILNKNIETGSNGIRDLAVNHEDTVAVVYWISGIVKLLDNALNLIKQLHDIKAKHVAATHDKKFAFTIEDSSTVKIYAADGTFDYDLHTQGLSDDLEGIAQDKDGNFIICDNKAKTVCTIHSTTGQCIWKTKAMLKYPWSVDINTNNICIVSDHKNQCMHGINASGDVVFTFGTPGQYGSNVHQLYWPRGVSVDAADHILVADAGNNSIKLLSHDGKYIKTILTAAEGLQHPRAVALNHRGHLLVGDGRGQLYVVKYRH